MNAYPLWCQIPASQKPVQVLSVVGRHGKTSAHVFAEFSRTGQHREGGLGAVEATLGTPACVQVSALMLKDSMTLGKEAVF